MKALLLALALIASLAVGPVPTGFHFRPGAVLDTTHVIWLTATR